MATLDPRNLRQKRKERIAARKKIKAGDEGGIGGEEMPDWLEDKIEDGDDDEEGGEPAEGMDDMPPADLAEEPEMPADLGEGEGEGEEELPEDEEGLEMESMNMQAAFNYNPIYQKPSKLGSNKPSGGYHYYGPPPDAGTSYGYFVDAANKIGIISPMPAEGSNVFSPVSGKPMKFSGKVGTDGVATVMAFADQMTEVAIGEETRLTSVPVDKVGDPAMFDALTGDEIKPAQAQDELPMDDEEPGEEMPMDDEEPVEEMPEEEEGVEGVEYEALQSLDDLGDEPVPESDVHMTLFGEGTPEAPGDSPFWNVDVAGTPVARVYLKDQPKPDEIRKVFCSSDYYRGVSGAISKVGLAPVLKQIKAHLWANEVSKTKLAQDIQAKVDAEAQKRVKATTENLAKNLLQRIAIVCAGMDKNFYKNVGNPLKEALWSELHKQGIANPSPVIEAAFRQGATPYFRAVLTKAMEYMEMQPEALEQIQDAIGDMDVLPPADESVGDEIPEIQTPDDATTLSERLAASSVAIAGMTGISGNPIGEHKKTLRGELSLGGAGPRLR